MRVLVADDDARAIALLTDLLTRSGYQVSSARSGQQALQRLEGSSFRLLITESHLPDMDGLELCRMVRRNRASGHVYTIILSDRTSKADVVAGLAAGADDYVCKPFHAQELLQRASSCKRVAALGASEVAVFALAKLAESRDTETGQHLERIRNYCWILARQLRQTFLEISDDFIDNLYQTSTLHDIGKVGIPDRVLLKPGRLTKEEFAIMKTHTTIGADTLAAAMRQFPEVEYLAMARDIALTHHECFDGSGYPQGLGGTEIPLSGRIVAVADVYDALTSQRPYKAAYEHEVAKKLILETMDRFDPRVLTAFLEVENEFVAVREAFSDAEVRQGAEEAALSEASRSAGG